MFLNYKHIDLIMLIFIIWEWEKGQTILGIRRKEPKNGELGILTRMCHPLK